MELSNGCRQDDSVPETASRVARGEVPEGCDCVCDISYPGCCHPNRYRLIVVISTAISFFKQYSTERFVWNPIFPSTRRRSLRSFLPHPPRRHLQADESRRKKFAYGSAELSSSSACFLFNGRDARLPVVCAVDGNKAQKHELPALRCVHPQPTAPHHARPPSSAFNSEFIPPF